MGVWDEEAAGTEGRFRLERDVGTQLRYLNALDRVMDEHACEATSIRHRIDWLESELAELKVLRSIQDNSFLEVYNRFVEILKRMGYHRLDTIEITLDSVLEDLEKYAGLQSALREARIYINYETVFPETNEDASE